MIEVIFTTAVETDSDVNISYLVRNQSGQTVAFDLELGGECHCIESASGSLREGFFSVSCDSLASIMNSLDCKAICSGQAESFAIEGVMKTEAKAVLSTVHSI